MAARTVLQAWAWAWLIGVDSAHSRPLCSKLQVCSVRTRPSPHKSWIAPPAGRMLCPYDIRLFRLAASSYTNISPLASRKANAFSQPQVNLLLSTSNHSCSLLQVQSGFSPGSDSARINDCSSVQRFALFPRRAANPFHLPSTGQCNFVSGRGGHFGLISLSIRTASVAPSSPLIESITLDQTNPAAQAISPARHAGQSPTLTISPVIKIEPKNATCRMPYHRPQVSMICKCGCQVCGVDELASQFPCPGTVKGVFVYSVQQLVTPGSRNGSFFPHGGNLL